MKKIKKYSIISVFLISICLIATIQPVLALPMHGSQTKIRVNFNDLLSTASITLDTNILSLLSGGYTMEDFGYIPKIGND